MLQNNPKQKNGSVHKKDFFQIRATEQVFICAREVVGKFRLKDAFLLDEPAEMVVRTLSCSPAELREILFKIQSRHNWVFCHMIKVALISAVISAFFGYDEKNRQTLCAGGLYHDIGKLFIPAEILQKTGPLCGYEMEIMRRHSSLGYEYVKTLDIDDEIKDIILTHHERLDGSGYPAGITGEKIREKAGIVMVADVLDAVTSRRPYREPGSADAAFEIISGAKKRFPPRLAEYFKSLTAIP